MFRLYSKLYGKHPRAAEIREPEPKARQYVPYSDLVKLFGSRRNADRAFYDYMYKGKPLPEFPRGWPTDWEEVLGLYHNPTRSQIISNQELTLAIYQLVNILKDRR